MPAYSKQLEDKDGNILYPITTAGSVVDEDGVDLQSRINVAAYIDTGTIGSPTPWIQTSDIVDGAVTANKIDLGSLNHTTIPSDSNGVDVTLSNSQSGKPAWVLVEKTGGARLGLGVDDTGSNHGIWSTPLNKWMIYSDGTYVYVNGIRIDDYRIKQYLFTTVGGTAVPGGADLNSPQYCSCGMYYCPTAAAGSTITNNPSGSAFSMEVRAAWDENVEFSGTWCYKFRIMYGYGGMWYQLVYTNGSGTPIYGTWKQLHNA